MSDLKEVQSEQVLTMLQAALDRGIITKDQMFKAAKVKGGRKPKDLPKFTFKGSGITVGVRKLGPFMIDTISRQLRDEVKPPEVPKVIVNYGTEEKPDYRTEENEADPEYKEALREYEETIANSSGRRILDTIIDKAIVVEEYDDEEIEATREFMEGLGVSKEELDAMSDHQIYVKYICIKISDDISDLQQFVLGESVPSEELVRKHEDSFRGNVSVQADTSVSGDSVGNQSQHIAGLGDGDTVVGSI